MVHCMQITHSHGMQVDRTAVQQTVAVLVGCLLRKDPGFSCPLVQVRTPQLPCRFPCIQARDVRTSG